MPQRSLFTPDFDGATYDRDRDHGRLDTALGKVWDLMRDGIRRTLREIATAVGCSESGASARLRDLRKDKFAALYPTINVERHAPVKGGLHYYSIKVPEKYRKQI